MSTVLTEDLEAEVLKQTDLYGAAIDIVVSHKTGEDCFKKMSITALSSSDKSTFLYKCKMVEDLIKKELSLTSMPNPWRSAKSVLSTAMENNIVVVDSNGNPKGKSKLQQEIAQLKAEKDPYTLFHVKLDSLKTFIMKHGAADDSWINEALEAIERLK